MAKRYTRKTSGNSKMRHSFMFKTPNSATPIVFKAKSKYPKHPVDLILTEDHIKQAVAAKGFGNTQSCAGAFCALAHADYFPHAVEGYVDWTDTRCYIVSKLKNGAPAECYVYRHKQPDVSRRFDMKSGADELLNIVRQEGPIHIRLMPAFGRIKQDRSNHRSANDGSRSAKKVKAVPRGSKFRFARTTVGLMAGNE